jgi:hypothetical protein
LVPQNFVPLRAVLGRNRWQIVHHITSIVRGVTLGVMGFESIEVIRNQWPW